MLLTLLATAALAQQPTVGHGEKVLLRYKFDIGDKITTRTRTTIHEHFYGREQPFNTVLTFDDRLSQVVQNRFVDETAMVDETLQGIKTIDGKPVPSEYDPKTHKTASIC